MEKSKERLEILAKIELQEREGLFDKDVENDPEGKVLNPEDVDYLHKKLSSRIKARIADRVSVRYFLKMVKKGQIVIDGYEGIENLQALKTGAILTANHFNAFDSIPIHIACKKYAKKHTLYKIIREGNYSFPGLFGFFMRNCYTLPLSSNFKTMKELLKAVDVLLKDGKFILVYAEQSMWWNYRKPKPLKDGAFHWAAKAGVPVLPMFTTMRDTDVIGPDGFPVQAYTLHILPPIYPKEELSLKENVKYMMDENTRLWKETYERVYGIPLTYLTKEEKK